MKGTIFVTAIGSFSAGAVIRTCREEGWRVLGCDIYPAEWVAEALDVDCFFQAPPASDEDAYRSFISRICVQNRADYLIPLTDAEVDALNHWRDGEYVRGTRTVLCISGEETISLCRNKYRLEEKVRSLDICPTVPGRILKDIAAGGPDFPDLPEYPLILKPFRGRSSQGILVIEDSRRMQEAVFRLSGRADSYLVQPKLEGNVVTVDVVRDPASGFTAALPRRELLRTPNGAGTSVYVFRDRELESRCAALAEALGIRGCVNFEFLESPDGERRLLECNPRFSGGVAFSATAGYDMVSGHLCCFTGRKPRPMGEIPGQYVVKRYTEIRTGIK